MGVGKGMKFGRSFFDPVEISLNMLLFLFLLLLLFLLLSHILEYFYCFREPLFAVIFQSSAIK